MVSFYLIAHSHGVSLLDAITDWRKHISLTGVHDPRYGDAFQGWFDGSVISDPFQAEVTDKESSFKTVEAWVISSWASVGSLAHTENSNGEDVLFINKKFSDILNTWNGTCPIVSMLNGNEHVGAMLDSLPAYDFYDPEFDGVDGDVPIVDELFIDEHIDPWIEALLPSLMAIKHYAKNPLIHVLPPPPRENPGLAKHLETLGDQISRFGFASDRLRLKWYRRYCRLLTDRLNAMDCYVLASPVEAVHLTGLLKEEYAEGLTHGTSQYGVLIARQLEALLEQTK